MGQWMWRPSNFVFGRWRVRSLSFRSRGAGRCPIRVQARAMSQQERSALTRSQRYMVVDITPTTVESLRRRGYGSFSAQFGDRRVSAEPVIGVGDTVTVTIWEAGAGGLFSAPPIADKVSSGANSATIPEQVVGRDGAITVPYAGRVHVANRTTRAVQAQIERALEGKAIQPQVLVNVTKTAGDSVSVDGEVTAGRSRAAVRQGGPTSLMSWLPRAACGRPSMKPLSRCRAA